MKDGYIYYYSLLICILIRPNNSKQHIPVTVSHANVAHMKQKKTRTATFIDAGQEKAIFMLKNIFLLVNIPN